MTIKCHREFNNDTLKPEPRQLNTRKFALVNFVRRRASATPGQSGVKWILTLFYKRYISDVFKNFINRWCFRSRVYHSSINE